MPRTLRIRVAESRDRSPRFATPIPERPPGRKRSAGLPPNRMGREQALDLVATRWTSRDRQALIKARGAP